MPRDGNGDFTRSEGPYVAGTLASASDVNNEMDDIAAGLSDSININGTKAFAANQPMGGFKLTGLAAGSSPNDSVRFAQVQPLDATLTALAALATTSYDYIRATGTDTFTLDSSQINFTADHFISSDGTDVTAILGGVSSQWQEDGDLIINNTTIVTADGNLGGQGYAAADIASAAHAVNTTSKDVGKIVYDTDNHRLMVANGSNATDAWYVADGSASVTPS